MAETAKWYVVHTYSAYENTVKATLEKTVETRHLQDLIQAVSIPMETVTEITENGPKTIERKVFPGYVLVKMVLTDETWYVVKNVRGATGLPPSSEPWRKWTSRRTRSASLFRCSDARPRSSWSLTRLNQAPNNPAVPGQNVGGA